MLGSVLRHGLSREEAESEAALQMYVSTAAGVSAHIRADMGGKDLQVPILQLRLSELLFSY